MVFDYLFIEIMDNQDDVFNDVELVLKYGVEVFFGDKKKDVIKYDLVVVDKFLD